MAWIVILSGLGSGGIAGQDRPDEGGPVEPARLASANNEFGFRLLRIVREEGKNTFLSPASVAIALHMTANGALGETRREMLETLRAPQATAKDLNPAAEALLAGLKRDEAGMRIRVANSLWGGKGRVQWVPAFVEMSRKHYDAPVTALDFDDPGAVKTINEWVAKRTEGKIAGLLDRIPGDAVAYLVNAVYFKGDWRWEFDAKKTEPAAFAGSGTKVRLMRVKSRFAYRKGEGYAAAALPFGKASDASLVLVLPDPGRGLGEVLAAMNGDRIKEIAAAPPTEGTVLLPRFTVRWKLDLADPLREMGMKRAFGADDFSAMGTSPMGPLYVGRVLHEAVIEVNEKGAEAAAATAVEMKPGGMVRPPWELRCDRPFLFAIYDAKSESVLFLGTFEAPAE
jgi:serine protease inhibitor